MPVAWELHYDRAVSEPFLNLFKTRQPLSLLVDVAKYAPYPVDLQFRHNPKTGAEHASLYVGLTDVLKVRVVKGAVRLSAHPRWSAAGKDGVDYGFSADWNTANSEVDWHAVEDYLERVLPAATASHGKTEGAVQAAVSHRARDLTVLDREAVLHFRDTPTRTRVMAEVTQPILAALADIDVKGQVAATFGGECDLLGVSQDGRIQAIEIKPRNVGTIRWAAAQATVYARLFERWLASTDTPKAPLDVLRDQWAQRYRLHLAKAPHNRLSAESSVVPVVVIQRGTRRSLLEDMQTVQARLVDRGVGYADLEFYEAGVTGKLTPLES